MKSMCRFLAIAWVLVIPAIAIAASNPRLADALKAAKAGDAPAQYIVGMMYLFGQETKQNIPEGASWLARSVKGGMPQAMVALAQLYDVGQGVSFDAARATQLRQQAAKLGNPTAIGQVKEDENKPGQRDFRRASVLTDLSLFAEAIPFAKRAVETHNSDAQVLLGRAFHFGSGVQKNYGEALRLYRAAADKGHSEGARGYAYMHEFGLGVPVNRTVALTYYDRAAAAGNDKARQAAANLRSPDYDRPPPSMSGDSGFSGGAVDTRCADNGGRMDGTTCFNANRQAIDPSNGQHYR